MSVKQPDFAGTWYPAEAKACRAMIDAFEEECRSREGTLPVVGGLVPHAGFQYSGAVAYNVVREMTRATGKARADTLLMFGGHLGPRAEATVFAEGELWTPLGNLSVDEELAAVVADELGLGRETPRRYVPDNTIELQLPLVVRADLARQVLVVRPPASVEALDLATTVVERAQMLGRSLLVLGSTDLTHYGPNYDWAPKGLGATAEQWVREDNDRLMVEAALAMDAERVLEMGPSKRNACCPGAAAAAIQAASLLGAQRGELLMYRTSADVRRDFSFVGYAGILY